MIALPQSRVPILVAFVLVMAVALTACGTDPSVDVITPDLGQRLIAQAADSEIEVVPTPEPVEIVDLTEEEILAGLPEEFAGTLASADATNGETLALTNGCIGCHSMDPAIQMTGPTWFDVADTAVGRVGDQSPALYLYTSIVKPNEHVVEGYPQNIMPQNYLDLLSQEDIADLVAYLLSQHE